MKEQNLQSYYLPRHGGVPIAIGIEGGNNERERLNIYYTITNNKLAG